MQVKEVKECKCFIVEIAWSEDSQLLEDIYGRQIHEGLRPPIVCETRELALEAKKELELEVSRKFEAWATKNKAKIKIKSRDIKRKGSKNVHYTIDADFPWDTPHNFESKEEIGEFVKFLDGVLGGTALEGEMLIRVVSHFFYTEKRDELPVCITEGELRMRKKS